MWIREQKYAVIYVCQCRVSLHMPQKKAVQLVRESYIYGFPSGGENEQEKMVINIV